LDDNRKALAREGRLMSERIEHAGVRLLRYCRVELDPCSDVDFKEGIPSEGPSLYVLFSSESEKPTPGAVERFMTPALFTEIQARFGTQIRFLFADDGYVKVSFRDGRNVERIDDLAGLVRSIEGQFDESRVSKASVSASGNEE
jgi:hypothetical protein